MTCLISYAVTASMMQGLGLPGNKNVDTIQEPSFRTTFPLSNMGRDRDVDILWVRSSFPGQGFGSTNGFNGCDSSHQYWEFNLMAPTGNHARKRVSGTTKDNTGAALGSCTVNLHNTSTGLLVDTQTSDVNGSYNCEDYNNVSCYAASFKAGSPDVAGVTDNNI